MCAICFSTHQLTFHNFLIIDCKFNSNTFTLDCSNLNLHVIPKDIPNSVRLLNLSFNEITQIDPLMELVNLTDLDLSNNKISHIVSRETFGSLRGLRTLLLNSNKLTKIESNAFETLTNLTHLDLSHNDELELDEPFLIQHNLVELNLDFCNLKDLPDGSFTNMSQLIELTLAGNPFDEEELSTSAFTPLTKLLKLRIPNLKSPLINSLCDKLQAIDVIQFDEYNISCLVLVDNNYDMDDAFIHNDPIERPKPHSIKAPPTTTPIIIEPTTTATTTMRPTVVEKSSEINAKPVTVNITTSDGGGGMSTNKTKIDTDTAQIDIDTETINMILLGELSSFQ